MPSIRARFVFSLMVVGWVLLPATIWGQSAQAPEQKADVTAIAATPAPSPEVDVIYVNGQLTIKAHGAPLIEVLRAACKKIGAELDTHVEPTEPISGTLGPGVAKEVLKDLLTDAHVNYVMGGTAADPNAVANIAIFPQTEDSSTGTQVAQGQTGQAQDKSASPVPVRSAASHMMELIEAAKGELANGTSLDIQNGDDEAGSASGAGQVDLAAVVEQIEAKLKATQTASSPSQTQHAATTADAAAPNSVANSPAGRPQHRKHH